MTARRSDADPGDAAGGGVALDDAPVLGPYDADDLDPETADADGREDFGALQVPVPPTGSVSVGAAGGGRLQAVHVMLAQGRLSVSALAAPRSERLWPELAGEIDASLRDGGARVRSFQGEWGRELHARTGAATSVFVGVDGPRWMLYGVATGPSTVTGVLEAELRRMLKGTVVVRGRSPYPVRTVLPLTVPEHLETEPAATAAPPVAAPPTADPDPDTDPHGLPVTGDEPTPGPAAQPRTDPAPVVPAARPADTPTGGRHARPEDEPADAAPARRPGPDQPALSLLTRDPMALFAPGGRHRRPD